MRFIEFPEINIKLEGMEEIILPKIRKIEQIFDASRIDDIEAYIAHKMEENLSCREAYKGKRICITAGSRGIPYMDKVIRTIAGKLESWGAKPFVIPAMGSHGGATAEGQKHFLAEYNITEESIGVPILSSMETVKLGELEDGTPVYIDRYAYESDGIVILNKIKPHTDFRAEHESGMVKMITIGLAKHKGASMIHRKGFGTFGERIPKIAAFIMEHAPVAFGVGIVQNAYDDIYEMEIMEKDEIMKEDARLLKLAKEKIGYFKDPHIDVLIIDEIGKNISGNGHDPNVTGRSNSKGFEGTADIKKLFIRGLNKETDHNGCGLSGADITTRRCLRDVDFEATWVNVATSTMLNGGAIPMYVENDRLAIQLAIRTCNNIDFNRARVVRIKDTMHMDKIEVSEAYYETLKTNPEIRVLSEPYEMQFDEEGFLL